MAEKKSRTIEKRILELWRKGGGENYFTWGISEMQAIGGAVGKLSMLEEDAVGDPEVAEQMSS